MSPFSYLLNLLAFRYAGVVAWLLAVFFLLRPAKLRPRWMWLALFVLGAMLARGLWFWLLGGHSSYPDLSPEACRFIGGCYVSGALLGLFSVLPPYRWWRARAVAYALVAVLLTVWGGYEVARPPVVRCHEVEVAGLPAAFDGMRIVHLSDIHCSPCARRPYVQDIVDRVNALDPDLICITGDIVDGPPDERLDDLAPLAGLHAKWGVVGCAGNHEYYSGYQLWWPFFSALGIRMLDNEHVAVTNGTDVLVVGGVSDKVADRYLQDEPDIEAAFSNAPPSSCRILLAHRPINVEEHLRHGVKLQLSGHTHGGVVRGLVWLPVAILNEWHVNGFFKEGDLTLHVTSGAGQWIGYPIRLGVPSEIVLLTLRTPRP